MIYDIIDISEDEIKKLNAVQTRMLRTAQQKKDELYRKADKDMDMFRAVVLTSGMKNSSLLESKRQELDGELEYQVALLADNLIYNMSLNEPSNGGNLGGEGGDEQAGYIVDYSLTFNERYVIVRDYYLAISDPDERMNQYTNDDIAKRYLASYYTTLYNVLATYSK